MDLMMIKLECQFMLAPLVPAYTRREVTRLEDRLLCWP